MLDDMSAGPLTLLVVPRFHFGSDVIGSHAFRRAMEARLARGDELVLHGMYHVDCEPSPRTARAYIQRRWLTRAEGEFAALTRRAAAWRIARGVDAFTSLGWPLHGFVPPAWLASEGSRAALAQSPHPFHYMTVKGGIHLLPEWTFRATANLCYSPDSVLRRAYSAVAIRHELRRARSMPLLRLSMHPQDARGPSVVRHWRRLVEETLADRRAVTKYEWVSAVRQPFSEVQAQGGDARLRGAGPDAAARVPAAC